MRLTEPLSTVTIERKIILPQNRDLWAAINGALSPLLKAEAWEDSEHATAHEIAQIMAGMFNGYVSSTEEY